MITIVEALTKSQLKEFVVFPFALYKNHPYWVPPLINDEMDTFDKTKNPVFSSADAHFYLAYKDNNIVGRIAAIINWDEVKNQQKLKDAAIKEAMLTGKPLVVDKENDADITAAFDATDDAEVVF